MTRSIIAFSWAILLPLTGCAAHGGQASAAEQTRPSAPEETMQVQYLEIVTPEVDAVCATYERVYGVRFSEPVAALGQARTADLPDGGKLGVRAPLGANEQPVVRPYLLVDDIEAAVAAAEAAGAFIAHPPLELPGQGTFAIYIQGGVEHGLWQR